MFSYVFIFFLTVIIIFPTNYFSNLTLNQTLLVINEFHKILKLFCFGKKFESYVI